MRGPPSAAVRVFRELYPAAEPNDPESLQEYGEYFLVPELRVELDLFYGSLDKNDPYQRKCRRPGVDYNDRGWRLRMAKWYYHAELFQIFDKLHLMSWEIEEVCTWWGSKAEVDAWETSHPGLVIGDDIWEGIAIAPRISHPVAFLHDPVAPEARPPPPRRRSSKLRRMIPRPRAIRGWRDLSHHDSRSQLDGLYEEGSPMLTSSLDPSGFHDDPSHRSNSAGVMLNQSLRNGAHSPAHEELYKDELDNGYLASASTSLPISYPPSHSRHASTPFQVGTNAISYRATPYPQNQSMTMPSYTQRMISAAAAASRGSPGMNMMPVAVADETPRSGQARQSSLGRYQLPRQSQYRPIRPRPMRHPSRG